MRAIAFVLDGLKLSHAKCATGLALGVRSSQELPLGCGHVAIIEAQCREPIITRKPFLGLARFTRDLEGFFATARSEFPARGIDHWEIVRISEPVARVNRRQRMPRRKLAMALEHVSPFGEQARHLQLKNELENRGIVGAPGRLKSWYVDVNEPHTEDEISYLRSEIYRRDVELRIEIILAIDRFSIRS